MNEAVARATFDLYKQQSAESMRFRQMVSYIPAAVAILDRDLRFLFVSNRWRLEHALGDTVIIERSFAELFPELAARQGELLHLCLAGMSARSDDERITSPVGAAEWLRWEIQPWHERDGTIGGLVVVTEPITKRKQAEQQLRYASLHDPLTGLANRALLKHELARAVRLAQHRTPSALLFLDLDRFKPVNDILGHSAGDDVLIAITTLLTHYVRSDDTLARVGGDEFAVLLCDISLDQAEAVASRMCRAVADFQYVQEGSTFNVGLSVGLVPIHGHQEAEVLLVLADMAMYEAKRQGGSRVHIRNISA